MHHLLFYDGECGLCDRAVRFVLDRDDKHQFQFAPLQGSTAKKELAAQPERLKAVDSLVLIENYGSFESRVYTHGKGALKIAWLLGMPWCILGLLSFLPAAPFDMMYRLVAKNRHRIFSSVCGLLQAGDKDRFLP